MKRFNCESCGACCKVIGCVLLKDNKCTVYESRPTICNVDHCYEIYCNDMNLDDFVENTKKHCIKCMIS
jgi:Fe-S-cluster containining protein